MTETEASEAADGSACKAIEVGFSLPGRPQ